MIKSMTGYGRGEKQFSDYKITAEIKSVNNRYLDYNVHVYKQYSFIEDAVRECISSKINRGKLDIFIQYDTVDSDDRIITLNSSVVDGYLTALKELADKTGLRDDVTVTSLSRFPDVFNIEKKEQDKDRIISDTKEVLMMALEDITSNRMREGARLYEFFAQTISGVKEILKTIESRSGDTVTEYRNRIKERIEEFLGGVEYDEARLLTEVAIFSDKVNITEELVRFKSHLNEFDNLLNSDVPVGRKLDFTIQELNREANTMGSKCNDFTIGKAVVDLKSEIEKLREQVQNIE